ncbi:MAG: type IV pilus biogenesis/stability protein PilW [Pseudomonadales bacterium]
MKFGKLALFTSLLLLQACGSNPVEEENSQRALNTYVELGLNYLSSGNRDQARSNLLRALEIDSDSPKANNAIALLYQIDGEFDLAEEHFRKALREDREFSQGRNNYARFLFMLGRFGDAREQYEIASNDVNYRLRPEAFIGLALSEKALGNPDKAEAALRRAITLEPRAGADMLELSQLKYDQEDYVTAKSYLDRYEATNPSSPRSLALGMQIAEKFGDDRAYETYDMALKNLFPNSREAREQQIREQQETD